MRLNSKTESISISLPGWLIDLLDHTCEVQDFSRSTFIKRALKRYLLDKNQDPDLWTTLYERLMEKS